MKALCVKQPYAFLLIDGGKTLEIRSWKTEYRGDLLICASASPNKEFWNDQSVEPNVIRLLPSGCMLGIVTLKNIRKMTKDDAMEGGSYCEYIDGAYAWEIEVPEYKPVMPKKIIGKLNLFNIDDKEIDILSVGDDFYNYPTPQGDFKFTKKCNIL